MDPSTNLGFITTPFYLNMINHFWKTIIECVEFDCNIVDVANAAFTVMCRYFNSDLTKSPIYFFDYDKETSFKMLAVAFLKICLSLFGQNEDIPDLYPIAVLNEDKTEIEVYILNNFCYNLFKYKDIKEEWCQIASGCEKSVASYYISELEKIFSTTIGKEISDQHKECLRLYLKNISYELTRDYQLTQKYIDTSIFDIQPFPKTESPKGI